MRSLQQIAAGIRRRRDESRMPYLFDLKDFDAGGITFEVSNPVERFRVVGHGDESDYTAAMLSALKSDDVLYDIGANIGLVALHSARICRSVVAFEPDPSFRQRLRRNLSLNPQINIDIEEFAISDSDGTTVLYTDGADGHSPSLVHQRGESSKATVETRSLDSLFREGRLPLPTVLKLDIEGAEILALRGAEELLSGPQRPRALFIEVHGTFLGGFGSSADEVYGLLRKHGYTTEAYCARRENEVHLILER
jgi:FkbM family methyltransferase